MYNPNAEKMNRKRENEKARRITVEFKRKQLELKSATATQVNDIALHDFM